MKHNLKKLFGWTLTVVMLLTMMLAVTITVSAAETITVGDFTIVSTDGTTVLTENTDYTYKDGVLTIKTTTPVTIGMKDGVTTTDDTFVVDSSKGVTHVTLDSITIDTDNLGNSGTNTPITVKGVNQATLEFIGNNSLSSNVEGVYQQVYGISVESKTPFVLTSSKNGSLSIHNVGFAVYTNGYTAGGSTVINGNIQLDIKDCASHAIYSSGNKCGTLTISGTPVINIDTVEYAMYAYGITISGGTITVKSDKGYPICSGDGKDITLKNTADLHIIESKGGLRTTGGKITITDSAKYKVYSMESGNKIAVADALPLISTTSSGEVEISKNAVVEIYSANDAISGGKTTISDNAKVDIVIDTDSTYSEYALSFDETLTISDDAEVDIDVVNGTKIRGLYDSSGTVNVSGNAVVTIDRTTYDGVYVNALNLSGKASVTVNAADDNAIYGDISVADAATLTATSVDTRVIYDPCTVSPAEGKVYMVQYGKSEVDVTTVYCTAKTKIDDKSTWRYFHAESKEPFPVTITFDTDGGSEIAVITQNLGTAITAPADPTKVGYTFAGWDKDIPDTMPGENMTITAKWTVNQYTITFDPNGGSAVQTKTVNYGAAIDAPTSVWEGHTFSGWSPSLPATMPAENLTVKAIWDVNTYQLNWVVDGVVQTTDVPFGATITAPADPVKKNYIFAGWDADIPVTMPARDLTFTARWTAIPENNIPQPSGGTVTPSTLTPALGETVTITLIPDSGMQIDTVTVHDADGNPVAVTEVGDGIYTYIQPEGIVTISVTFKEIPRETDLWLPLLARLYMTTNPIIASAGEGGTITSAGITQVKYGRSQDYTIVPDEGYVIADVLVNGKSVGAVSAYTFKKVRRPQIIEVIFVADPNAVVEAPAEESDEVADPMYSYDQP